MKKYLLPLLLLLSTQLSANTLNVGDIYSYSFTPDSLFLTGTADPLSLSNTNGFVNIDQATIPGTIDLSTGISTPFEVIDFSVEVRVFENNDPLSTPLNTFSFSSIPGQIFNNLGLGVVFILPKETWADLDGLIEVEVIDGYILGASAGISAENNGLLYSSISPVPLPASLWLLVSGLAGIYGLKMYIETPGLDN